MAFSDGDFLKIEYSAWRVADNTLVYTTDKKKAEEQKIFDKDVDYSPKLVILGRGTTIKGLENAIKGMSLSETKKVTIEPKEAFGERSQELVRIMPMSEFKKRDMEPYPGMQLDLDGMVATIKSVSSGRVLVDANHPLAGERLTYEVKIVAKVDKQEEKAAAIFESNSLKPSKVSVVGRNVEAEFDEKIKKDGDYFMNKARAIAAIYEYLPDLDKIVIKEEHERPKKEEKK